MKLLRLIFIIPILPLILIMVIDFICKLYGKNMVENHINLDNGKLYKYYEEIIMKNKTYIRLLTIIGWLWIIFTIKNNI